MKYTQIQIHNEKGQFWPGWRQGDQWGSGGGTLTTVVIFSIIVIIIIFFFLAATILSSLSSQNSLYYDIPSVSFPRFWKNCKTWIEITFTFSQCTSRAWRWQGHKLPKIASKLPTTKTWKMRRRQISKAGKLGRNNSSIKIQMSLSI